MGPSAKEKLCPKPGASHSAPFQPSPYESVISRIHVAPSTTVNSTLEVYGAPPLSVVPSEQLRLQPTSLASDPLEQMIVKKIVGLGGGSDGGEGLSGGCEGGVGGAGLGEGGAGGDGEGDGGEGDGGDGNAVPPLHTAR
eukprot:scaffold51564_cov76-Phaeocystis_antarctica.AAC.1